MNFWYIVEEKAWYDQSSNTIGAPISAEIVDVRSRHGDGHFEYHDTESVDSGIYTRQKWCRTKAEALEEISFWMR